MALAVALVRMAMTVALVRVAVVVLRSQICVRQRVQKRVACGAAEGAQRRRRGYQCCYVGNALLERRVHSPDRHKCVAGRSLCVTHSGRCLHVTRVLRDISAHL